MKIKYSEKTQKFELVLDGKDFYDAIQIEEMVNGKFQCRKCGESFVSEGWKVLKGYLKSCRELIIESGKDGTKTRAKRDLSDLKFAKIDGFDYAMNLPERIILQTNLQREAVKKQEEIANEARNDD